MISRQNAKSILFTASLFVCVLAARDLHAADLSFEWPQWRGPTRDGQADGPKWPASVSKDQLGAAWSIPLGPSYSGPIVAADRVFVTETHNRQSEVVRALERNTGREIWRAEWSGAMSVPFFAKANGDWIRATPAFDGERLYVAGMRDVLVCLDGSGGAELWRIDFPKALNTSVPSFGCSSSPLVAGDSLYMQAGNSLVRIDKLTGEIIWRGLQERGGMSTGGAFSSPVLATLGGKDRLLVQTRKNLVCIDPETGSVLWSREIPAFRGMNILTPTVVEESVFTSTYGGGSFLFSVADSGGASVSQQWRNKLQGYMSSPVVIGSDIYVHLRNQRFACIDSSTGDIRWITKPFGKYWSMVAQEDRILALDERGDLLLIQANPEEFELIDSRKVSDDSTWAHLAVAGGQVFIRALGNLTTYRWE